MAANPAVESEDSWVVVRAVTVLFGSAPTWDAVNAAIWVGARASNWSVVSAAKASLEYPCMPEGDNATSWPVVNVTGMAATWEDVRAASWVVLKAANWLLDRAP